jgi:hypothetical protein
MALSNERDDRCLARFGEIARIDAVRVDSVKGLCEEGAAKGQVIPQGCAHLLVMYTL